MKTYLPPEGVLKNMRDITPKGIIVHHTAGADTSSPEDINHWFTVGRASEGYVWAGYHALLYKDGTVVQMRPWTKNGGHCPHFNNTHIGISFVGNYENEEPPLVMWNAYLELKETLKKQFNISEENITNHRDANLSIGAKPTLCPGKYLYALLKQPVPPAEQHTDHHTCKTLGDYTTVELLNELTRRYEPK